MLYSRFAGPSIYMGMRNLLLLLYATLAIWIPHLIYFWFSVMSLCLAPFVFNPHQFSFSDFIIDYREFLRWMSRGNSRTKASSWYGYCRLSRTMITGYKKKKLGHPSEKLSGDVPRAKWKAVIFSEILWPLITATLFVIAYMFVKSFPDRNGNEYPSPLIRISFIAAGPILWNAAVLMVLFFISLCLGPMMENWPKFASVMAASAHLLALFGLIAFFEFFVRPLIIRSPIYILTSHPVVLGALGRFSCRPRRCCYHCYTTRDPEVFDFCFLNSRVQA
jgi:1,3-beta-glucan synthase